MHQIPVMMNITLTYFRFSSRFGKDPTSGKDTGQSQRVICLPLSIIFASLLLLFSSGCSERFSHSVQQIPAPEVRSAKNLNYNDSTITLAAGKHYGRSKLHTLFYGKHYRKAWTTPVQVNLFDLKTAKGGLKPLKMGGSRQTINLRLVNPDGIEYVLRSVDKEPASALPERLHNSYLANIIRDATSATHPYAALTIPKMAEALNIYHPEPELVFIPHDPRLGPYADSIGGTLALLERRPDGDQSDNPQMGRASNIKSSRSVLRERLTDNDSNFDARFYLRARFLDIIIGDWSRHEDNWRWAELENDKNSYTFKAVPRDRDNVFYKLADAPIPWLFMRLELKPHFQTFRRELKNLDKLNRSGRNLDELILAELELDDWLEVADSVQRALTDEVLEEAIRSMPDTIYKLTGPAILAKLKSRREQLPKAARQYFNILSEKAQVTGTDKHEHFEVNVLSPERVLVRVHKQTKDGKVKDLLYERSFYAGTTKEIQLYGLGGNDMFELRGNVKTKIKIRIWGGAGEDVYLSASEHSKSGKNVRIIDSRYRNSYSVNKYISVDIDNNPRANEFDAEGWLLRYYLD